MAEVILNRRAFLINASALAGGMSLSLMLPTRSLAAADSPPATPAASEFSAWLTVSPDDTVTVFIPTGEFGTGSYTQVPMNVTEELGVGPQQGQARPKSVHDPHHPPTGPV